MENDTKNFDALPVKKVTANIGDGVNTHFIVEHPAAPFCVTSLFRSVGGEFVLLFPGQEKGRVIFAFAKPPQPGEFIAVVIG